jgi:hypothetical protein
MKKLLTIVLAVALFLCMSVPVFADIYDENDTEAQTNLSFSYVPEPSFTVSIPGSLDLEWGDNYLPIEVSELNYLGSQSLIVITFAGTHNETTTLDAVDPIVGNYLPYIGYAVFDAKANQIEIGSYLAVFNSNGSQDINIYMEPKDMPDVMPNNPYTGYIIFGIKVV